MDYITGFYGISVVNAINDAVSNGNYSSELWYKLTKKSIFVLFDEYKGRNMELKYSSREAADENVITFGFAGDIQFDYGMACMRRYKSKKTITSIVSEDLLEIMKGVDIMAANNEFPVSTRGEKVYKHINFRSEPENLPIYYELGVDFVSLANNHVYDYGPDAFMDTIQAMIEYKMDFAGAGKNLAEASEPFFYVLNGRKIAILCGSRAEKTYVTPIATEDSLGVFGMYDSENMKAAVAKAKAESDFVIIYTHWGKENSYEIEKIIRKQGHEYIDCGADLIVGVHAHELQGIEFYRGKMIAYNL
ncbi:MAG: CapA family protein, partial [Clostridia bacterium]|nr:CapA family protein [Clostridia bacterium]